MLSSDQNALLTRSGSGTPMGTLLRRYWQPVALAEELPAGRTLSVRVMGEDLVLFRDAAGQPGLLGLHCAHRGAPLSYGRVEDDGLRCIYHGWLYGTDGRCREQPAEPAGSQFRDKVRQLAYPCREVNGLVYAYLGADAPPPLPSFDWVLSPPEYVFAFKGYQECNFLQATEGEIDPAHLSFLHRYLQDHLPEETYGEQFLEAAAASDVPISRILREQVAPQLEVEETDYGLRLFAVRELDAARRHVRVTNYLFPNAAVVAVGKAVSLVQWHVPIDDTRNWRYDVFYSLDQPVEAETLRRQRLESYTVPDYRLKRNQGNAYGFDPAEQQTWTYAGVGFDFNTQDTCVLEGMGAIQDRTTEHLGYSDKPVIAARRQLLDALEALAAGRPLPLAAGTGGAPRYDDLVALDTSAPEATWRTAWRDEAERIRHASPWAEARPRVGR